MIIWLASYPKSGNTWVRIFLSSIIYSEGKNLIDEEILRKIRNYPHIDFDFPKNITNEFKNVLGEDEKRDKKKLFYKNWINSQTKINLNNKINILKTHNMLCKFEENSFTNLENSLGVIHIVRDPRNVITSLKNHYSKKNYEDTKKQLFDEYRWIGVDEENKEVPTLIGSWKTNYLSWKRFPKNNILIKYEDLILNPEKEFFKIIKYLKQFIKLDIDDNKIRETIDKVSFENLRKLEEKGVFKENAADKETGKLKKFFYLGPKNNWKETLDKKLISEIEIKFEKEMKELGYL